MIVPSIILIPAIIGMYIWNFHNGFSSHTQDWSNFGSYIGGTLGSLFAFLAFLAGLQNLNEIRKQRQKEEILSSIKGYEKNLEKTLPMVVTCNSPLIWGNLNNTNDIKELPLRSLLQGDGLEWESHLNHLKGSLAYRIQPNGVLFQDRDIWLQALNASKGLFKHVDRYKDAGGDESLIEYYVHTYEIAKNRLEAI